MGRDDVHRPHVQRRHRGAADGRTTVGRRQRRRKAEGTRQKAKLGSIESSFLPFAFCLLPFSFLFLTMSDSVSAPALPSHVQILQMAGGHFVAKALYAVAELG